jgi:BirA family transcriptional regulator, biotin operon repressor / biotin---[acetyl-CoA-carboxylase] ligase
MSGQGQGGPLGRGGEGDRLGVRAQPLGLPRVHHRRTGSTNERARELALGGAPHGTLVTADEQTSGRGRQGRSWTAPPRSGLLMSLLLRDFDELLPLTAAVAICEALPVDCRIKWPNDVWLEGRKLAGILVEGRPQAGWAVLGIGLNVTTEDFPDEIAETATSLQLAGVETTSDAVLERLLPLLEHWLAEPTDVVLDRWRSRDALHGKAVRWSGGEGMAAGIDESGGLLVDTADERVTLSAGEVHLTR